MTASGLDLALEHGDLMTQKQGLRVLHGLTGQQSEPADYPQRREVDES